MRGLKFNNNFVRRPKRWCRSIWRKSQKEEKKWGLCCLYWFNWNLWPASSRSQSELAVSQVKSLIFFSNCRKLVEQTMMEHENTKEARRKLQEYKQKLGKEFFVEFFHRSTRFSYDNNYFIGVLDHITWTNRCSSAYFYWWFTPILITSSYYLLTFYSHFFIVQFGVVLLL